jgi:hypothetical protein
MKYTVDGTRYTTVRDTAQVEVEADDERQAAERAQDLAYALKWEKDGAFAPTYKWEIGEDGDHVFDVDDLGEMTEGV